MFAYAIDQFESTLDVALAPADGFITLPAAKITEFVASATAQGFTLSSSYPIALTVQEGAAFEVVHVKSQKSATELWVNRGADKTTAQSFTTAATVSCNLTAYQFNLERARPGMVRRVQTVSDAAGTLTIDLSKARIFAASVNFSQFTNLTFSITHDAALNLSGTANQIEFTVLLRVPFADPVETANVQCNVPVWWDNGGNGAPVLSTETTVTKYFEFQFRSAVYEPVYTGGLPVELIGSYREFYDRVAAV